MIPYTTIPLVSAFFLVLVGVLIGHFIWYRYRDEQENLANGLRRQIDELRSSLKIQTDEFAQAQARIAQVESTLETEREKTHGLQTRLEEHELLYESAADDLEKSERINVELREELEQQAQQRIELGREAEEAQCRIKELEDSLLLQETDRKSSATQIDELTSQCRQAAESMRQLEGEIEQLNETNSALKRQLEARERELDQFRSLQLESSAQFEREHQKLVSECSRLVKENEDLQKANSEYAGQLESQLILTNDLSGKVSAALVDLNRLERIASDHKALQQDRDRLIDELDARQVEIKQLTTDLDEVCTADAGTREELKRVRSNRDELEKSLQEVTVQKEESEAQLREQDQRRKSLERALAAASEELAQLQIERERLEGVEDEVVELDAKLRQALTDLQQVKRERDEALTAESSTREIVVELRDELHDRLESVQSLEEQKEKALSTLESEVIQRGQVTSEMERVKEELDRLNSEYVSVKRRDAEQSDHLTKLSQDFEQLQARSEQASARVKLYQQRISDLEQALETGRDQQPKRPGLLGRATPTASAFSFRQVRRKEDLIRADDKTKVRHDKRMGLLYSEAPFRSDDLRHINGITGKMSRDLNKLGVFTYKQIMEWDRNAIAEFAQRIGADQIVEQDWVGQARRLYHQNYRAAA